MNDRTAQGESRADRGDVTAPERKTTMGEAQTTRREEAIDRGDIVASDAGFLPDDRLDDYRDRWSEIQTAFVDDPKNAVQQAHALVTELVDSLVQTFTRERTTLEQQWSGGGNADTEELRIALQRYRDFFNRLLSS